MPNVYTLVVSREEIESLNVRNVKQTWTSLESQLGQDVYQCSTLMIDGYNDLPEELYEIPRVRSWVQKLFREVPHLFYYLNRPMGAHHLFLQCLGDVQSARMTEKKTLAQLYAEGYTPENLPQEISEVRIPTQIFDNIVQKTVAYSRKMKDSEAKNNFLEWVRRYNEFGVF